MKKSGKCPKCESTDIIADAKAFDHGHYNTDTELEVGQYGKPYGWFDKDKHASKVSAWVCMDCGYIEYYADNPRKIILKKHQT